MSQENEDIGVSFSFVCLMRQNGGGAD